MLLKISPFVEMTKAQIFQKRRFFKSADFFVIRRFCHSTILSFDNFVIRRFCHSTILSFDDFVIRRFCHFDDFVISTILSFRRFCHSTILSFDDFVISTRGEILCC
jgi:hypothetical protein